MTSDPDAPTPIYGIDWDNLPDEFTVDIVSRMTGWDEQRMETVPLKRRQRETYEAAVATLSGKRLQDLTDRMQAALRGKGRMTADLTVKAPAAQQVELLSTIVENLEQLNEHQASGHSMAKRTLIVAVLTLLLGAAGILVALLK